MVNGDARFSRPVYPAISSPCGFIFDVVSLFQFPFLQPSWDGRLHISSRQFTDWLACVQQSCCRELLGVTDRRKFLDRNAPQLARSKATHRSAPWLLFTINSCGYDQSARPLKSKLSAIDFRTEALDLPGPTFAESCRTRSLHRRWDRRTTILSARL